MASKVTSLRQVKKDLPDPRIAVATANIYATVNGQPGPVWSSMSPVHRREYLDMAQNIQAALYIADGSAFKASQILADYLPGSRSTEMAAGWWFIRIKAFMAVVRRV